MLINGNWTENWQPVQAEDEQGRFIRQTSSLIMSPLISCVCSTLLLRN